MASSNLQKATRIKDILLIRAVSREGDEDEYRRLRGDLLLVPCKDLVPECVLKCRSLQEFWDFISVMINGWKPRRAYIGEQFSPLLDALESEQSPAIGSSVLGALTVVSWDNVQAEWTKILERKNTDSAAAITSARTMLESVCKHILDGEGIAYAGKDDLQSLYRKVTTQLTLAPSQQTTNTVRQIMSGCISTIEGIGALRNQQGDAHGKGSAHVNLPRLSELAINAAGTMASYLIREYDAQQIQKAADVDAFF